MRQGDLAGLAEMLAMYAFGRERLAAFRSAIQETGQAVPETEDDFSKLLWSDAGLLALALGLYTELTTLEYPVIEVHSPDRVLAAAEVVTKVRWDDLDVREVPCSHPGVRQIRWRPAWVFGQDENGNPVRHSYGGWMWGRVLHLENTRDVALISCDMDAFRSLLCKGLRHRGLSRLGHAVTAKDEWLDGLKNRQGVVRRRTLVPLGVADACLLGSDVSTIVKGKAIWGKGFDEGLGFLVYMECTAAGAVRRLRMGATFRLQELVPMVQALYDRAYRS